MLLQKQVSYILRDISQEELDTLIEGLQATICLEPCGTIDYENAYTLLSRIESMLEGMK